VPALHCLDGKRGHGLETTIALPALFNFELSTR